MNPKLLPLTAFLLFLLSCKNGDKKQSPQTAFLERNGVKIAYTSCGDADTTMLFIHGFCINKGYWDGQIAAFCPRYKVVAVDLPGFGQSGKNRTNWTFTEYGDDIKYLIDQLKLKNVVVLGHSMSGDIVLDIATRYPDAVIGLVGVDNLHEPAKTYTAAEQAQDDIFFAAFESDFRRTVDEAFKPGLFQPTTDTSIVNRVMNDVYNSDTLIAVKVIRGFAKQVYKEKENMNKLSHKLYLVNSDVIPVKLDSLNKYCRSGVEALYVHATGHYPMLEKPAEFNAQLQAVMNKIGAKK